jgi:hypothetical protein
VTARVTSHSKETAHSATRAGFIRSLLSGVSPETNHSSMMSGPSMEVAFIAATSGSETMFTTNWPVAKMFLLECRSPENAIEIVGGL